MNMIAGDIAVGDKLSKKAKCSLNVRKPNFFNPQAQLYTFID